MTISYYTKIETEDLDKEGIKSVSFNGSPEMQSEVFLKILEWYFDNRSFSGESVQQCDRTVLSAPEILGDIADMIDFKVEYK